MRQRGGGAQALGGGWRILRYAARGEPPTSTTSAAAKPIPRRAPAIIVVRLPVAMVSFWPRASLGFS
jgi:hypothetical protein